MSSLVVRLVGAISLHDGTQCVLRGYDEPKLLTRVEHQASRKEADFDFDDVAGVEFLDSVEAVDGYRLAAQRFVEMAGGHSQPAVGAL